MQKEKVVLRVDDVFACTKKFEIYGKDWLSLGAKRISVAWLSNFLFFKFVPGLRRRLPYEELSAQEWERIFDTLRAHNAKMTVGITAVWVEPDNSLVPFFEKFPFQAAALKRAQEENLIEIANHGYTHCVVGRHLPFWFSSNRDFHREFWPWIPLETHRRHIETSQRMIQDYFGRPAVTFIPPGNVWTEETEIFAFQNGIRFLSAYEAKCPTGKQSHGLLYISRVLGLHDRDIVDNGLDWFEEIVAKSNGRQWTTVKDLGEALGGRVAD